MIWPPSGTRRAHGRWARWAATTAGPDAGADYPLTLGCAANLVIDLRALGAADEADQLLDDTIRRYAATLGPEHPDSVNAASGLGQEASTSTHRRSNRVQVRRFRQPGSEISLQGVADVADQAASGRGSRPTGSRNRCRNDSGERTSRRRRRVGSRRPGSVRTSAPSPSWRAAIPGRTGPCQWNRSDTWSPVWEGAPG